MKASSTARSELIESVLETLSAVSGETNAEIGHLPSELEVTYQQYMVGFVEFLAAQLNVEKAKQDGSMELLAGSILEKFANCLKIIMQR